MCFLITKNKIVLQFYPIGEGSQFMIGTFLVIIATIVYGWYGTKDSASQMTSNYKVLNESKPLLRDNN